MFKRLIAGPLWFLATLSAYSFAAVLLGAPREVGPIVSFVIATLVVLDPGGLIWTTAARPAPARQVAPNAAFAAPVNPAD